MDTRVNLRVEQGVATRSALIAAARELFAQKGYHEAGTNDLVAAANVTRGALYHHFQDKEALFEAVFLDLARELHREATLAIQPFGVDRWRQLQEGLQAHLRLIAGSRAMQRVLLVDGPAVFGWSKWRALQSEFSLGSLVVAMEELIATEAIQPRPPLLAAHLVLAVLNEAALLIAHSDKPEETLAEVGEIMRAMVTGLR